MDKLEKVVADLKHLDGDELNKVWGFSISTNAIEKSAPNAA